MELRLSFFSWGQLWITSNYCQDSVAVGGKVRFHIAWVLTYLVKGDLISLWPSDAIWGHKSQSTLAQVMSCFLKAPSHYLNQCWFLFSEVLWHSPENNFTASTPLIIGPIKFINYTFRITATFPRGQCVNEVLLKQYAHGSCFVFCCSSVFW